MLQLSVSKLPIYQQCPPTDTPPLLQLVLAVQLSLLRVTVPLLQLYVAEPVVGAVLSVAVVVAPCAIDNAAGTVQTFSLTVQVVPVGTEQFVHDAALQFCLVKLPDSTPPLHVRVSEAHVWPHGTLVEA